ncbi:MAG: AAA family ATPase [Alphaproteobacteria bacterium]
MKPATIEQLTPYQITQADTLERFGTLHVPAAAEPPVLSRGVRAAMHQWMTEIGAEDELAAMGLAPRRTGIFSGPPGCGKTTLAHHLAARLRLPLYLVDMHRLTSKWIGETGENVGRMFTALRRNADRLVLLLDEFDAMASKRIDDGKGASREKNAIVISFLQEIDRADSVIIAATNRADAIDPALWRRFGMHVEIGLPDGEQIFAITKRYLAPLTLPDEALHDLAALLEGATPALIRQIMEGVKRDLLFAPRLQQPAGAASTFGRVLATVQPAEDLPRPPLYEASQVFARLPWPPAGMPVAKPAPKAA